MKKIIECIPNFSEGRDQKTIEAILEVIKSVPGAILLDHESDASHNRSVITFAGEPKAVLEAAFQATKKAAELIDLDKHRGEHPRMGATDVCPLVPISGVKEAECIKYAEELGARIGKELKIPVYLYEKAARKPERENLADIRKGEYEGIKKEIGKDPARKPDFGPAKLGKAGATAVGVRAPLIAYNINLRSNDLEIAKKIAKTVRHSSGGFKHVKALGFELADKGIVQVSMNLTNYKQTTVHQVFEAVKKEAHSYGVEILESEVIGLIPQAALIKAARYYLQIDGFKNRQILETILQKKMAASQATSDESLKDFIDRLASKNPVPGGGSASALAGTLAAALAAMVANLTRPPLEKIAKTAEQLKERLYLLIQEDSDAYGLVVTAYRRGKETDIQNALKKAAQSPLEIAETSIKILDLLEILTEKGNKNAITDCGVALHLIETAVKGGILNVRTNLNHITSKHFTGEMLDRCKKLRATLDRKVQKIEETVERGLG